MQTKPVRSLVCRTTTASIWSLALRESSTNTLGTKYGNQRAAACEKNNQRRSGAGRKMNSTGRTTAITAIQLLWGVFHLFCAISAEQASIGTGNAFLQLARRISKEATSSVTAPVVTKRPHRILVSKNRNAGKLFPSDTGFQSDEPDATCDKAFYECLGDDACTDCFTALKLFDIDWTGVTVDTDCGIVLKALSDSNVCEDVGTNPNSQQGKVFCETFHTCVVFDDDDDDASSAIDCDKLEKCEWEGKRDSLIGDGVCHDRFMGGCYNSKVCQYDGGDCCQDTCKTPRDSYLKCGSDGYMCRDPDSAECDPTVTLKCPPSEHDDDDGVVPVIPVCLSTQHPYRIEMRDSFGDGWDETMIKINDKETNKSVYAGQLKDGAEGLDYMCLSVNRTCYTVVVAGGSWGRESTWDISSALPGSPTIAAGGGLMNCEFPVAGATCTNTCTGRSNRTPTNNDDYTDLHKMDKCINEKCVIQKQACIDDSLCTQCLVEVVPEECFTVRSFKAVTDCATCKCVDSQSTNAFCDKKLAPGVLPVPSNKGDSDEHRQEKCTPMEVIEGGTAILEFANCMRDYGINSMLMDEYDQNNFGELDDFEACAHGYNDRTDHGGNTALRCVEKLTKAMEPAVNPNIPTKAIAEIAKLVYQEGDAFCNCAKQASDDCPLCPAFFNFKALLYESLDACEALDQIDCAAWDEFQKPCREKFISKYGSDEFKDKGQCDYIHDGCDKVGPFPAFRRFNCKYELRNSKDSWEWYMMYEKKCVKGEEVLPPAPLPAPTRPTMPPIPHEQPKPSNIGPNSSKSSSSSGNSNPTYHSPDKKSSHLFRNLMIVGFFGGIGYFLYKRQADGFNFVRYRRMAPFGQRSTFHEGDMYSGLSLEGSTFFEPPTLPPTPMSMPHNGGYGA